MKKKYISPKIEIIACETEHFIATSNGGEANLPDRKDNITSEGEDVDLGAKKNNLWGQWDDNQ